MWQALILDLRQFARLGRVQQHFFISILLVLIIIIPLLMFCFAVLSDYRYLTEEKQNTAFRLTRLQQNQLWQKNIQKTEVPDLSNQILRIKKFSEDNDLLLNTADTLAQSGQIACQLEGGFLDFLRFVRVYQQEQFPARLAQIRVQKNKEIVSIDLVMLPILVSANRTEL